MNEETCGTCHYWAWLNDDFGEGMDNLVNGWCKRFPPKFTGAPKDEDGEIPYQEFKLHEEWNHPVTLHHHWCGEWKELNNKSKYRPIAPPDEATTNAGND